jgi:hypothetical protein
VIPVFRYIFHIESVQDFRKNSAGRSEIHFQSLLACISEFLGCLEELLETVAENQDPCSET